MIKYITEDANRGKITSTDQVNTLHGHNTNHPINEISHQGEREREVTPN